MDKGGTTAHRLAIKAREVMCLNTQLTEQQSPSLGLPWSHCVLMPSRDSELVRKDSLGLGISSADGYSLI